MYAQLQQRILDIKLLYLSLLINIQPGYLQVYFSRSYFILLHNLLNTFTFVFIFLLDILYYILITICLDLMYGLYKVYFFYIYSPPTGGYILQHRCILTLEYIFNGLYLYSLFIVYSIYIHHSFIQLITLYIKLYFQRYYYTYI